MLNSTQLHIINKPESGEYDSDLESTMVEIAYFSIQTGRYSSALKFLAMRGLFLNIFVPRRPPRGTVSNNSPVIYQSSGIDTLKDSTRKEARLEAARTTLLRIQRAQALSKTSQYNSAYLKSSFTNW